MRALLIVSALLSVGLLAYGGLQRHRAAESQALADERLMELAAAQGQLVGCTAALHRQTAAVDSLLRLGAEQAVRLDSARAASRTLRRRAEADARAALAARVGASADSAAAWLLGQAPRLADRYRR